MPYPSSINITIGGNDYRVQCKIYGDSGKYPCYFLGPGEVYLPTFPEALLNQFCFISVDMYWVKDTPIEDSVITSLSFEEIIENVRAVQETLELERMLLIAPSALGIVAVEYAHNYPEKVAGIIGLGTPFDGITRLNEASNEYINANYNPSFFPSIQTNESESRWSKYLIKKDDYEKSKEESRPNEMELYLKELDFCNQIMYYDPDNSYEIDRRWPEFNLTMRKQIFFLLSSTELSNWEGIDPPVFSIIGKYDGLSPFWLTTETNRRLPSSFYCFILEKSGHNPFLEEPLEVSEKIKEWFNMTVVPFIQSQHEELEGPAKAGAGN